MKVPVGVSNRHIHLNQEDYQILFQDQPIEIVKPLVQEGQFASNIFVTIQTPKGQIEKVRMIGPLRTYTQVEMSQTDAYKLGLHPPVRDSGDLKEAASITIIGPCGKIEKPCAILANRHIHMNEKTRKELGLEGKDEVSVHFGGLKSATLEHVALKVDPSYVLEMHLDTDDANALLIKTNDYGEIMDQ